MVSMTSIRTSLLYPCMPVICRFTWLLNPYPQVLAVDLGDGFPGPFAHETLSWCWKPGPQRDQHDYFLAIDDDRHIIKDCPTKQAIGVGFKNGMSMVTSHLPHHLAISWQQGLVWVGVGNVHHLLWSWAAVVSQGVDCISSDPLDDLKWVPV